MPLGIVDRCPELLFLDEPTTGIDPRARRQFWELIRAPRGDSTTSVLTIHYLDEVVSWDGSGGRESVETTAPAKLVARLAEELSGEVPGLTVTRPTLEDVYLELIGATP